VTGGTALAVWYPTSKLAAGAALVGAAQLSEPQTMNEYLIAGMVMVAVAALKLGELVVTKALRKFSPPLAFGFTSHDRERLESAADDARLLRQWHQPNSDGRQEWKNPDTVGLLREVRDALLRIEAKNGP
jgi:hypothetical protein